MHYLSHGNPRTAEMELWGRGEKKKRDETVDIFIYNVYSNSGKIAVYKLHTIIQQAFYMFPPFTAIIREVLDK
jgi:hypothetical protein